MNRYIEQDIIEGTRDLIVRNLRQHIAPYLGKVHGAVVRAQETGDWTQANSLLGVKNKNNTHEELIKPDLRIDRHMRHVWQQSPFPQRGVIWHSEETKGKTPVLPDGNTKEWKKMRPEDFRKLVVLEVDPVDGSGVLALGLTEFTSSYALVDKGVTVFSAVCKPVDPEGVVIFIGDRDEAYKYIYRPLDDLDESGQKAELANDAPIRKIKMHVSEEHPSIDKAYISTAFAWDLRLRRKSDKIFDRLLPYMNQSRSGAASVHDIVEIAQKHSHAHISIGLKPCDEAASAHLVVLSGGRVTNLKVNDPSLWDTYQREILATNGLIHDEMFRIVNWGFFMRGVHLMMQMKTRRDMSQEKPGFVRVAEQTQKVIVDLARHLRSKE